MPRSKGQIVYPATLCIGCEALLRPARSDDSVPGVEHAGGLLCVGCAVPIREAREARLEAERLARRRTMPRDLILTEYRFARDVVGLTTQQSIADHLGVPKSTLYTALLRAKRAGDPRVADWDYTPRPALSESLRAKARARAA